MDQIQFITKNTGDTLAASEWNQLTTYTNYIVQGLNEAVSSINNIDTSVDTLNGESLWEVEISDLASNYSNSLPPGYDNDFGSGAYASVQYVGVPHETFVRYQTYTESEILEALNISSLSNFSTGNDIEIFTRLTSESNTYYVKLTRTSERSSCTATDIVRLIDYMKNNNQGPWASQS